MQRLSSIIVLLLASFHLPAQSVSNQNNQAETETLRLTSSISRLSDYNADVIGYYLNKPLYLADFNIYNLKKNINTPLYAIDPKSPSDIENNAAQEYLALKYSTKNSFEKEELVSLVAKAETSTEQVKKSCINLSNYFGDKEYLKDLSFNRYPALRDSLQQSIFSAQAAWRRVSIYNSDVKDMAENIILKGKKASAFIVPMKEDLDKLRKIVSQVYSQDFSVIILKMDITDLQSITEIHKDFSKKDRTKLKDESYINVYNRFYGATDECLAVIKQILNCVEQKKFDAELDSLFDTLNKTFTKVEEDYKLFASQD